MRNPERINAFCEMLKAVWHKYPDYRFGQLLWDALASEIRLDPTRLSSFDEEVGQDLWNIEESEFETLLKKGIRRTND